MCLRIHLKRTSTSFRISALAMRGVLSNLGENLRMAALLRKKELPLLCR
jgi:hypothetical protein